MVPFAEIKSQSTSRFSHDLVFRLMPLIMWRSIRRPLPKRPRGFGLLDGGLLSSTCFSGHGDVASHVREWRRRWSRCCRRGLSCTWARIPTSNSSTLWSRPLDVSMNLHPQLLASRRPTSRNMRFNFSNGTKRQDVS